MATDDSKPKRTGLGWIPKLSLWAVVIAFGYLYLSSVEHDSTGDSAQLAAVGQTGTSVDTNVDTNTDTAANGGGLPQQLMGKLDELTSSAGTLIADATTAGSGMFKNAVDKVKDLAGVADEPAAEIAAAETGVAEPGPVQPAVVEAPVAETPPVAPVPAVAAAVERPAVSAFERHSAPLPAVSIARPAGQAPEAVAKAEAVVDAPAAAVADAAPVADTEASVFAESLMRSEPVADTSPEPVMAPTEAAMPTPPAPLMPVHPQPVGQTGAWTETMPAPAAMQAQQAAAAEYRARMMAEYENRRRLSDQRAREYWESMQGAPGQVAPPMGYPAYAPGYGPGYGPPAFQR